LELDLKIETRLITEMFANVTKNKLGS
jgi:hypothetical protein